MKGFSEAWTSTGEPDLSRGIVTIQKKRGGKSSSGNPFSLTFYDTKHRIPASTENRET